jgi:hypothetical protein
VGKGQLRGRLGRPRCRRGSDLPRRSDPRISWIGSSATCTGYSRIEATEVLAGLSRLRVVHASARPGRVPHGAVRKERRGKPHLASQVTSHLRLGKAVDHGAATQGSTLNRSTYGSGWQIWKWIALHPIDYARTPPPAKRVGVYAMRGTKEGYGRDC